MAQSKRYGLVLTAGGAPAEPHIVPGIPGHYRPDVPTPVGEEGEVPLEDAKAFANDHPDALKLVEIKDVKAAEEAAVVTQNAVRNALPAAKADAETVGGMAPGLVQDEQEALAGQEA